MFYVRCIRLANWPDYKQKIELSKISSDAITKDLKTENKLMSWWKIDAIDEEEFDKIAATLVSQYNYPGSVALVAAPKNDIEVIAQKYDKAPSVTAIIGVENSHYNMKFEDYETLGKLAGLISSIISENKDMVKRYPFPKLVELVKKFDENQLVNRAQLGNAIKKII
jgi:hypothetical protein